jgi:hypothetical protein
VKITCKYSAILCKGVEYSQILVFDGDYEINLLQISEEQKTVSTVCWNSITFQTHTYIYRSQGKDTNGDPCAMSMNLYIVNQFEQNFLCSSLDKHTLLIKLKTRI